jgi:DNA-binding SARP family transcriptional activator/tetratricopeptide (TPR) repeat protein
MKYQGSGGEVSGFMDGAKNGEHMIQLRALGGVSILDEYGSPITLRSRKHVGLLLLMASSGRRVFSRRQLCDLFWTSDEVRARHSLSQAVYDLTRQLGPLVNRGPGGDLSLNTAQLDYDVGQFEFLVKAGDLAAAVELYRGPFADNLIGAGTAEFDRWLDSERTRIARLGEVALRRYVGECETRGQWGSMCVAAVKLAAVAPLDEEVHRTFMRALWLQGDAASALSHYESIVAELEAELSGGISTEMEDLVRRIRARPKLDGHQSRTIDREPPFVGREREFQTLREAVARIRDTSTTAIVVSGEAGIGKSRLIKEFDRSIQVEPLRVLSSRCYQAEEDLPYTPIVDGLMPLVRAMVSDQSAVRERFRRLAYLLPDFGSRDDHEEDRDYVDPAAWRRQLYEEAASFLAMATDVEPIVWIVDDVQWIDRASGGLIHYLSRRLADRPFLLVLTIRNARGQENLPPLPVATPSVGVAATLSLPLLPLKEDQIRNIVSHAEPDGCDHPAAALAVRLSAGNPYYALEVLEAAAESKEWAKSATDWDPLNDDRLRKVLDIRVSGLGSDRIRVLQAIAVLERHARPRLVAEVSGLSLTDAAGFGEELYNRSLIVDEAGRVAFTNDAMREYVYAEMNALQRASLHLSAGQALEAEADATPGVLATHFYFGDDWPRSFGYAMEAARSAQSAAGHSEAAHFAGIAAKAAPGLDERCAALGTRAESLFAAGELAEAAACYEEILGSPGRIEPSKVSDTYLRLAATEIERCNWEDAGRALDACARVFDGVTSADQRLYLQAEHSTLVLKHAVRTDNMVTAHSAGRAIDSALDEVKRLLDPSDRTMLAIFTSKAVLTGLHGSCREALDYLRRAEAYVCNAQAQQKSRYFTYRGIVRAWLADWEGAEADFNCSRTLAERTADRVALMTQWNNLACISLERGDWGTAEDRLEKAAQVQAGLEMSNDTSLPITLNRANLQFYQGYAPQAAETYSAAAQMCDEQASSDRTSEVLACLGLVALQRGERDQAEQYWRSIPASRESYAPGLGTRERFKVAWFTSVMKPGALESRLLLEVAQQERERDLPSHLKLLWLDAMLVTQHEDERRHVRDLLKQYDLAWFCHFGRRWARMAGFAG